MVRYIVIAALLLPCSIGSQRLLAEDGRYFEKDGVQYYERDGVTYRESRQQVPRPVTVTEYKPYESTVLREQYTTDLQESQRTYSVPVTEYQWVGTWERGWNPFAQPYYAYRLVPQTRWESRSETVKVPVTRRDLIPEKRTTHVPVVSQKVVHDEIIHRVAVDPSTTTGASNVANRDTIGGVHKLDNDPPKQGTWHAADDDSLRR